ncbi:MAG: pyridoxamine 5'-phosphate oxidase [Bacteroidales bacterium]|nr:pyridoxamine 5'-phosphate oxidase [Bacteroidales bacterium]
MNNSYQNIREEYLRATLDENSVLKSPFDQFNKWMNEAFEAEIIHPTSMLLATAGNDGQPSCRIVLLKNMTETGFVFYTNYESRKGQQLAENPKAALTFFWMEMERQIRIEGQVEKVDQNESDVYFNSRPLESRLSAAVSPQSRIVKNRQELEKAKNDLRQKHPEGNIPRPQNWGGFILKPHYFEFWQGRESRLHDRVIFSERGSGWIVQRLAP